MIFSSLELLSQDASALVHNNQNDKTQIRLGLTGYFRAYSNFGIEFDYERFISPHWSVEGNVFGGIGQYQERTLRHSIINPNSIEFNDYHSELITSFSVNYYLKKDTKSGHYLSIGVNTLFGLYKRNEYSADVVSGIVSVERKRLAGFGPEVGIYYGYRKRFNSGLFVEGRIGTLYQDSINNVFRLKEDSYTVNGQISLGWVIPFKRNK